MNKEIEQIAIYKSKFKWPLDTVRYALPAGDSRYLRIAEDLLPPEEIKQRIRESLTKLKVAKASVDFWRNISWVEMVFVTGSTASLNALADHDIDLWIIVKPNRIWLTRFFEWIHFNKLGSRRNRSSKEVKNLFCINYYKTTDDLKIRTESMAYAMQFVDAVPIFIRNYNLYAKLLSLNSWIEQFFPSWYTNISAQVNKVDANSNAERNSNSMFWDFLNFILGFLQQLKIKRRFPKIREIFTNEFTTWQ
jgi:hypothetical protein